MLYQCNGSSKPESFQELLLFLYSINTSTYVPTNRERGKSDIVDPDVSKSRVPV